MAGVDAGAKMRIDAAVERWHVREQVVAVIGAAHLNTIHLRQQADFITNCPEVFKGCGDAPREPFHVAPLPPDRLEVDIVLKQYGDDLSKLAAVLPKRHVLQLQNVDLLQIDAAVNRPLHLLARELRYSMRQRGCERLRMSGRPDQEIGRGALRRKIGMRVTLVFEIEEHQQVQVAQRRKFHARLIHEHSAAMNRRTDRIRRYEQNGELLGRSRKLLETIAEVAAQGSA